MATPEGADLALYPLSFCKDLSDHLVEVLSRENIGLLAGRAVYDFFAEYAAVHHRFAVDLAKACKATRNTLVNLSPDGESSFVKTCMAIPVLVMQLSQSHMAHLNQVTREALKPAEKYDQASRERHEARKEEIGMLSRKLDELRRRLEESRSFVNQTVAKLAKTNIQKDKKAWLRRRNKTIDRLEEYKTTLTTANSVATDLRLNEASSLLLRMHEEEERRVIQLQNTLTKFATVSSGSQESSDGEAATISQKLHELAANLDPITEMTQYIFSVMAKEKQELAVKQGEMIELERRIGEKDDELTSLSASLTRRHPPPPPPSPTKRGSMVPSNSSSDLRRDSRSSTSRLSELENQSGVTFHTSPKLAPLTFNFAYEINTPKELWGAVSERSSKQTGMFFSSIEGVMEHQERCFPSLHRMQHDTPIILDVLLKAATDFGEGLKTKGLCTLPEENLSPSKSDRLLAIQTQTLREQYESGNFRFVLNSALPAGSLLQNWLLELAEPLIPNGAYLEAVDMISECTPEEVESRLSNLVSKLPALHWRVLHRVLGFILSLEQHQQSNGMTRELLAHCFAPCLVRGQPAHRVGDHQISGPEFVTLLLGFFDSPSWAPTEVGRDELAQDLAIYNAMAEAKQTVFPATWDEQINTCQATRSQQGSMTPRASVSCCLSPGCLQRKLRRGYCLNHVKAYLQQHTTSTSSPPAPTSFKPTTLPRSRSELIIVDSSSKEKRQKVFEELLSSEQTYVAGLKLLQEKWVRALENPEEKWIKAMAGVTHSEVGFMTDHLTTLANFHTIFLAEFEKDLEHAPSIFLCYAAYFKMYSSYMNSFDVRLATLNRLRATNKKFAVYVKHIEDSLKAGGLNLASYLIMPVQRIPRYVLLLKELTKNTPPDHPDYRNHLMALEKVKAIAAHINSAKADAEALAKLMQVQYKIPNCTFELVQPHRQIVREGSLTVVSTSKRLIGSGKPKSRYVFLFNDMLLWINEVSSVMKGKILLTSSTSANQLDNLDLEIASNNEVFVARIADPVERKAWLDSFREVIRQQKFIYANKRTALNRRNNTIPDIRRSSQSSEAPSEISVISTADHSVVEPDMETKFHKPKRHNSFSSAMDLEGSDSEMEPHHHHRTDSTDVPRPSSPIKLGRGLTILSKQPHVSITRSSISHYEAPDTHATPAITPATTPAITPVTTPATTPAIAPIAPAFPTIPAIPTAVTPRAFTASDSADSNWSPSTASLNVVVMSPNLTPSNRTPSASSDSSCSSFRPPIRPTSLSIPNSPDSKITAKPRSPSIPPLFGNLLPPPSTSLPPPPSSPLSSPSLLPPSSPLPSPPLPSPSPRLPPPSPRLPPPSSPLAPPPSSPRPFLPPPSTELPPPPSTAPPDIPPPPPEENDSDQEPLPPPAFPPSPDNNCTIRVSSNFTF